MKTLKQRLLERLRELPTPWPKFVADRKQAALGGKGCILQQLAREDGRDWVYAWSLNTKNRISTVYDTKDINGLLKEIEALPDDVKWGY